MTLLGALNFVVVQWTFFRLAKVYAVDGSFIRWKILGPVVPLTGWWSKYIRIGKL